MPKPESIRREQRHLLRPIHSWRVLLATVIALLLQPIVLVSASTKAVDAMRAATDTAPASPGCGPATPVFGDAFLGHRLGSRIWNPYFTSRAANGYPWDSNGASGSSMANPAAYYNEDYDTPSSLGVHEGLTITARDEPIHGVLGSSPMVYSWRSGSVTSYGHFEFDGGCLTVDAKMPSGSGMWPALWLLPGPNAVHGDNYEIDLFEGGMLGASPAHSFSWHEHTPVGVFGTTVAVAPNLFTGYNRYGLRWVPGRELVWYLNGVEVASLTSAQAPIPNEPMELIMNLAVANGASAGWHTLVTPTTPRTDVMRVRSVAVYS